MTEQTQKTVYFFGAGASNASDFILPCMKGFFGQSDLESGDYPNLSKFVQKTFPGILLEELNVEEVITFLESSLDTFASFGRHPDTYIYEARREFDIYINWRLSTPNCKGCKKHRKIIGENLAGMDSKDSIITLNYDLIVDNTLWEMSPKTIQGELQHGYLLDRMYGLLGRTQVWSGERPSLYHKDKELGFYLKLHSSVNWLYCPQTACGNHQLFFPNWFGLESSHNKAGDPCKFCGSPLVSVIVPPAMQKSFEKYPKLGLLWNLAYKELNKADRIVVFGISFAPSDYYLTWLFKKAVIERVESPVIFNINFNQSTSKRIEKITGVEPVHRKSLDEFFEQAG